MTFAGVVTELLTLSEPERPSAVAIKDAFAGRATKIETGDENLSCPKWASGTRGKSDLFLTWSGDLAGMAIWEDRRGWGTYVELAVADGALADLEKITGATKPIPRNPDDFDSGPKVATHVERGNRTVRVFAELDKVDGSRIRRLTIHFEK